ncbi:MAG TPA: hypothetical protein VK548_24455, partial [Candidatus Acidoferrum sp.]|nr:hypothetical protein [Candidatus Acidoferrum sp.]
TASDPATVIYIPAGTYVIKQTLVLPRCQVTIRGDNNLASVIKSDLGNAAGTTYVFQVGPFPPYSPPEQVPACESLRMADLGFQLTNVNGRALLIYDARSITIDRIRVSAINPTPEASNRTVGLELVTGSPYATAVRINDSLFLGLYLGVYLHGTVTASSIRGGTFFGPGRGVIQPFPSTAVWICPACTGMSVVSSVFENYDIGVESRGGSTMIGFNHFENQGQHHVLLYPPATGTEQSSLVANVFFGTGDHP